MKNHQIPLYGGEPIPFSRDPVTLKLSDASFIESSLTGLLREAENFTTTALKDPVTLRAMGLPEDLPGEATPLGLHIPFARFDFLWDGKNLVVLELNTDGTSGYNLMEWLGVESGVLDAENPNKNFSLRVLEALREHDPKATEVALMDFPEVKTDWEQQDLVDIWSKKMKAQLANPAARTWTQGALIYRRALSWQLRFSKERARPFLDDWKEKKITVVGGWSSDVGMSKVWPALAKPKFFPETFVVTSETVSKIKDEKDQWVLKGALSYAGRAVIRGKDLSQEKWMSSLQKVNEETQQNRPWVAQKLADVPLVDSRPCEFGLYLLNGKPAGYMCRWGSLTTISDKSDELLRPVRIAP